MKWLIILVFAFACAGVNGQDISLYQKHWLVKGKDTLPYRLLLPGNYQPGNKYPLIIFLHGSGERGRDNEKQLVHGAGLFLKDTVREKYPAIVVFPQCGADSYWSNVQFRYDSAGRRNAFDFPEKGKPTVAMKLLESLMEELGEKYRLDQSRIYIGGLSMGGMGTFEMVARHPQTFAAAFPICGGANPLAAGKMRKPGWWIFHGLKDNVVPPEHSRVMAAAIAAKGGQVRLSLYPEANHNSWDSAFAEKELLPWLFSQTKRR